MLYHFQVCNIVIRHLKTLQSDRHDETGAPSTIHSHYSILDCVSCAAVYIRAYLCNWQFVWKC